MYNYLCMNNKEIFIEKLDRFQKEFLESEEYLNLRKANADLYEDLELIALNKEKEEIESSLSLLVDKSPQERGEEEQQLLKRYVELKKQIESLPSVIHYNECYGKIKDIKDLFNDKIYRKII